MGFIMEDFENLKFIKKLKFVVEIQISEEFKSDTCQANFVSLKNFVLNICRSS